MSPQFGSIIWDLLFDPLTEETLDLVREDCVRIVSRDPRMELLQVNADEDEHTIYVRLELRYKPTTTVTDLLLTYNRDVVTGQAEG